MTTATDPGWNNETWRDLYGAPDGRWLIVTGPIGEVGTPRIGDLINLGSVRDAIVSLVNRLHEISYQDGVQRPPIQQQVATIIGVTQQSVAKYVAGLSEPRLSNASYANLVQTLHRLGSSERSQRSPG